MKGGRRTVIEVPFEQNARTCRTGRCDVGIRFRIVEYGGTYNRGHPVRSIIEKALQTRSPELVTLYSRY